MKNKAKTIGLSVAILTFLLYYGLTYLDNIMIIYILPIHLLTGALLGGSIWDYNFTGVMVTSIVYGLFFYKIASYLNKKNGAHTKLKIATLIITMIILHITSSLVVAGALYAIMG